MGQLELRRLTWGRLKLWWVIFCYANRNTQMPSYHLQTKQLKQNNLLFMLNKDHF